MWTLKLQIQHFVILSLIKIARVSYYHGKNSLIKKSKCRSGNNEFTALRNEIVSILSVVDFTHLIAVFTNSNDKILRKVQETYKGKWYNLGFFERDEECNDPNQMIINFSSYQLNDAE